MTCRLRSLCFDASDPRSLARFWASLLHWEISDDGVTLRPGDDTGFEMRFAPTQSPKSGPNQLHFHLTSTSLEDQQQTAARATSLGARPVDFGQRPEEGHLVLADPEDNEFCVIEPGNGWLAGCGFFAELACEGSAEAGYFWSAALDWPLVWDQDQETAIRAPHGGPKIAWGGPPLAPKTGKYRMHFDLVPEGDQQAEVDRLISLGATPADIGQGEVSWVVLADPDGHEFCVLAPDSPVPQRVTR
jgi:predicted enzyme related to lactoylglutathione lyase